MGKFMDEQSRCHHESITVPFEARSVHRARTQLAGSLQAAGIAPAAIADAQIVLSELVTNAVRHGRANESGQIEIDWTLSDHELLISVSDGGDPSAFSPRSRLVDADAENGRGLAIIATVANRWWVDGNSGVRVNAELTVA